LPNRHSPPITAIAAIPPIAPAAIAAIGTDDLLDGLVDETGVAGNDELEKAEVVEKPAVV
jgi:hypothetical protein